MNDQDFNRTVVVTASHGEKYLGFIPMDVTESPQVYVEKLAMNRTPIVLENVRILMGQMTARQDAKGSVIGVQTFIALMPIDVFSGPVGKFHTLVSSWYFPSENPETRKKIERLIDAAEKNEQCNKAVEAGLHVLGRNS